MPRYIRSVNDIPTTVSLGSISSSPRRDRDRLSDGTMKVLGGLGLSAVVSDLTGTVRWASRAATELYRCDQAGLLGRSLASGPLAGNDAPFAKLITESVESGGWLLAVVRLAVADDRSIDVDARATRMGVGGEHPATVLVVFPDTGLEFVPVIARASM